jgi:hypothetical protein
MGSFAYILLNGFRHVTVGVAILAVLMVTFRVHVHAVQDDGHGHAEPASMGSMLFDLPDNGGEPQPSDPDGCGSCHAPGASQIVLLPSESVIRLHIPEAELDRHVVVAAIPDSLNYPPEPPPARLS